MTLTELYDELMTIVVGKTKTYRLDRHYDIFEIQNIVMLVIANRSMSVGFQINRKGELDIEVEIFRG